MPKTVPAGLLSRLCRCYAVKVVRDDGVTIGLTDTNVPFVFQGLTYSPVAGVSASNVQASAGTAAGNLSFRTLEHVADAVGASITAEDLRAGRYQNADVWVYELDPTLPSLGAIVHGRYRIDRQTPKRAEKTIQLKETHSLLEQQTGRTLVKRCDALQYGDLRCDPSRTIRARDSFSRTVVAVLDSFTLHFGGESHANGYFTAGEVVWTTGRNAGLGMRIGSHTLLSGNVAEIVLSTPTNSVLSGFPAGVGDVATLVRGCDRLFGTCQGVTNPHNPSGTNAENYQGFRAIPLPDDMGVMGRQTNS